MAGARQARPVPPGQAPGRPVFPGRRPPRGCFREPESRSIAPEVGDVSHCAIYPLFSKLRSYLVKSRGVYAACGGIGAFPAASENWTVGLGLPSFLRKSAKRFGKLSTSGSVAPLGRCRCARRPVPMPPMPLAGADGADDCRPVCSGAASAMSVGVRTGGRGPDVSGSCPAVRPPVDGLSGGCAAVRLGN